MPGYMHRYIHTRLPTNIHDFSIHGFPHFQNLCISGISIFLTEIQDFEYFWNIRTYKNSGNTKILEMWKSRNTEVMYFCRKTFMYVCISRNM